MCDLWAFGCREKRERLSIAERETILIATIFTHSYFNSEPFFLEERLSITESASQADTPFKGERLSSFQALLADPTQKNMSKQVLIFAPQLIYGSQQENMLSKPRRPLKDSAYSSSCILLRALFIVQNWNSSRAPYMLEAQL